MSNDEREQSMKKKLDGIMEVAGMMVEKAAKRMPGAGVDQIKAEALLIYKDFLKNKEVLVPQEYTEAVILAIGIAAKKVATNGKREASMSDKCNSCGAEIKYAAGSQSLKCQYCGATNEIQKAENQLPSKVEVIIPLTVSQDDLEKRVYSFMASGNWTPDDMLEASTFTKKECFYVPAYLIRVKYKATWTASFGYDKKEPYTDYRTVTRNNRQHQEAYTAYRTVTDWKPANGVDSGEFWVSAYAGKKLGESDLSPAELVTYVISQALAKNNIITSFNPSFTKGVETEMYSVPEASALASLKDEINSNVDDKVQSHGKGDHQKDWHWNATMSHETNTIYVPICHAVYDYEGTEYHVWIDGIGGDDIRADKLPEDKGRKKLVYFGFVPLGVGLAALIVNYFSGTFTFYGLVIAAILGGGYAAIRSWHLIEYSKKIRDSLLTQIHASSNTIKVTGDEERDKVARSFQRPEKPLFAKTHYDKFVLPALSVLVLISINSENTKHSEKMPQAVTLASKSGDMAAPVPIATPAPTLPVVVKPDTASAVEAVSSVPASVAVVSSSAITGWVKLVESEDVDFYVNASSIRKAGDKATILTLSDFKSSKNSKSGKSYMSNTNQDEYDCKENKERLLNIVSAYSENMGRGEITATNSGSNPAPGEWSQVTPNSLMGAIFKIACGQSAHVPAGVVASPQAALMPSFDCTKASTFSEKAICSDPLLGNLDGALSKNYKYMLASDIGDGARNDLKTTQKDWLAERNKCTDNQCLANTYRKRMDEVCEYPVISGAHPICTTSDDIK